MNQSALTRVSREHRVALVEGGFPVDGQEPMPHYYVILCKCGYRTKTYHGHDHAQEIGERHVFAVLHEIEMTPGGANRKSFRQ